MNKKVILMYGGSFNPPLISHFSFAEKVLEKFAEVDKIIFMPVSSKYNKQGLIDDEHRYNMLCLGVEGKENLEVSRIELNHERQLYTIETLEILEKKYPEHNIWFMVGTDNLKTFDEWQRPEELMKKYKILVIEREPDNVEELVKQEELLSKYKESFITINGEIKSNLSSTKIREKIKNGEDITGLLPKVVQEYIEENKLYK